MFGLGPATRIYLAAGATDMRKGFEGLYGLVRDRLSCEPLSGHLFLFCNAQRNDLNPGLGWNRTLGVRETITQRVLQLAAVRRCARQDSFESRRTVLIIGWNRPGENEKQTVVPQSKRRRRCCRIKHLVIHKPFRLSKNSSWSPGGSSIVGVHGPTFSTPSAQSS